ncbi:hypothetical protein AB0B79_40945, partial [Streptomyces sp. NPDC039022]|uniref:hypothetical protein n=1 Tax=Streptomyces sp. NPDC039022 TaxID=3157091 RepID=UPI0033E083A7
VRLARRTLGTIRANLVWAFGYNLVTVPLAIRARCALSPPALGLKGQSASRPVPSAWRANS